MKEFEELQAKKEKIATAAGVGVTILAHALLVVAGVFSGVKYLDPPPPETTFVIDFSEMEEEQERPQPSRQGRQPQADNVDKTKPVELIQQSESHILGKKANEAPESIVDDKGDVEVPQPERKKEINRKSLFPSADNKSQKDTAAPQTASKVSETLKEGHASGNTKTGRTEGEPNAKLKGRNLLGTIPTPSYSGQAQGKVVVKIWVDNYGKVQKAIAGDTGTSVADKQLWAAARSAALKAHFNMSAEAPAMQEGTITFIFKITK